MKKEITVATINVFPAHDLIISSACSYYETTKEEMLAVSNSREHARRKGILFYLLKEECQLTSFDIAGICNTTRQNVSQHIDKAESAVAVYLQSACDFRNIKGIYSNLLTKQEQWLQQLLPQTSTKH